MFDKRAKKFYNISMNNKKFEYSSKDTPFLKKDIIYRSVFIALFLAVFVWQMVIIFSHNVQNLPVSTIVISMVTMIIAVLFILICLLYISKSTNALSKIKKDGRCVSNVLLLANTDKKGFLSLYEKMSQVLAFIITLVLISITTYTILQLVYLNTYSNFIPLIYLITICGFNSVYHIRYELTTLKTVQAYNAIY